MAFIITPGQYKQQGEFYHQLGSMTAAGVTIAQAIDLLRKSPPSRALGRLASGVMDGIVRGATFTEAVRATGRTLPEFDVALIEAGEASGRLDQCFKLLGDFYAERGRLTARVLSQLMYPVFLVHFAILIFPTSMLSELVWKGNVTGYFLNKIQILLPVYAIVAFLIWTMQADRSRRWRAFLEQLFRSVPIVGKAQQNLAMARLCAALEALITAGVRIIEAWDLAGNASGSPRIIQAVAAAKPRMQQGELPSDAIEQQRVYPDLFTTSYRTGELSGQLDETLKRLYRHYLDAATESLQRLAEWLPKLIYFAVLLGIAFQILTFYSNYFNQINQIMGE